MFRALPCSYSGGLRRNCIYAASGVVTVCRWLSCVPVKKEIMCWCGSICMLELLRSNAIKGQFEWKLLIFFALSNLPPFSSQFQCDSPYESNCKPSDAGVQKYIILKKKNMPSFGCNGRPSCNSCLIFFQRHNFFFFPFRRNLPLYMFVRRSRLLVLLHTVKAGSHIACRARATPMPFPCHAVPLRI
jgi:hypothetical protein